MGESTTDHEVIRKCAEARGGQPARVKGTGGGDDAGLLRLDFGKPEENLKPIEWEEFFDTFDESDFVYDDAPESRFGKLVRR